MASICSLAVGIIYIAQTDLRPEELMLAERARFAFKTGHVDFSLSVGGMGSTPFSFAFEYGENTILYKCKGRADTGCAFVNEEDAIGAPYSYSERRALRDSSGRYWRYIEDDDTAKAVAPGIEPPLPFWDIQTLGLVTSPKINASRNDYFDYSKIERFETITSLGATIIRGMTPEGNRYEWTLEPAFDYQPVSVSLFKGGQLLKRVDTEYDVYDGLWFPKHVSYYNGDGTLAMEVEVEHAEFDRPTHPKELTPPMLGMPMSTQVGTSWGGVLFWDGEGLISVQEAHERQQSGDLSYERVAELQRQAEAGRYPGCFPKTMQGADFGLLGATRKPRLWEEYVRRFIQVFALNEDQSAKAWESHKHWLEKAEAHLNAVDPRVEEIDGILEKLKEDSRSAGTPKAAQNAEKELERQQERKNKLLVPIEKMFVEGLRPALFRLPTNDQKAVVLKREEDGKGSSELVGLLKKP